MLKLQKVKQFDSKKLEEELLKSKAAMKAMNNTQWDEAYPLVSDFQQDINEQQLYGFYENQELIGLCALTTKYEAHYYNQKHNFKYRKATDEIIYVHRIIKYQNAKKFRGTDFLNLIIDEFSEVDAIQIDTNESNIPMQKAIEKAGFIKRGIFQRKISGYNTWYTYEWVQNS